ncbi:hypothetical protein C2845_PM05G16250 [Panicum miliaceum]|uniref:Uncharacterized protein n=1 Tax=Panicum miliaceum TaxID=4540 RepID=A0A3L6T003_PANMI|nr:hypothetical protein C2845_PM05G16250 [Panicum miliaceum]
MARLRPHDPFPRALQAARAARPRRHLRVHAAERRQAGRRPAGAVRAPPVAGLGLPEVEGLPDGAESTADVPPEKVALLKKAFDGLVVPFAGLVAGACAGGDDATAASFSRKPDWIILDFAHNWIWPIAEEHEVSDEDLLLFLFQIHTMDAAAMNETKES